MRLRASVVLAALVCAGCAAPTTQRVKIDDALTEAEARKQGEIALEALMADQFRLYRVSQTIRTKAVALCGENTRYGVGAYTLNQSLIQKELHEAAASLYAMTEAPRVMLVAPGSAAERAGVQAGDVLTMLGDWKVEPGENGMRQLIAKYDALGKTGAPMRLALTRGSERIELSVTPEKECKYRVVMVGQDVLNAYADGENVIITRGMMRFAADDTELALVVSHELAHNAMKHMDARRQNYMLGSIIDILIAARTGVNTQGLFGNVTGNAYSQEFESEADYVGLYMMAHAGLDIENAPKFWRRMAAANPSSIRTSYASTHPSTPQRMIALEQAVNEIAAKRASGVALLPEMKDGKKAPAAPTAVAQAQPATSTAPTPVALAQPQPAAPATATAPALQATLIGKQEKKLLLFTGLELTLGLSNATDRTIRAFRGSVKFFDEDGAELGSVNVRADQTLKPGQSARFTESVYGLLFPGLDKLKAAANDKLRLKFEHEAVEFSDGSRLVQ